MFRKHNGQKGFTLVEAAIALMMAAIIIGGAMKGMQMVENQRITAAIAQVNQIQTSTQHFRGTYKALPGDLADGHTRISGCSAACENTSPGAGDGFVGAPNWDLATFQSASIANAASSTTAGETVLFWLELQKAGLLTGITTDGVNSVPAAFGKSLPPSSLGGGFLVGNSDGTQAGAAQGRPAGAGAYSMTGTVLAFALTPATLTSAAGTQPISPSLAYKLDKKMDDGMPNSGTVQAYGATARCYGAAAPYNYSSGGERDCGLYFRIDEPQPINGVCGAANGTKVAAVPTSGLCDTGIASAVTCPQQLSWACQGQNGGINTTCGATLAAGTINAVSGTVTVTPNGGASTPATANMPVFQGDAIQTAGGSSAAITFADNSTIALGDNANLTVDQYSYDATVTCPQHRSFFTMLQGIFVYTSGLIGTEDASAVNISTPVGSIGIRGTRFGGDIRPLGQTSTLVIFSGAIALTNSAGTQQISTQNSTITTKDYQEAPVQSATLSLSQVSSMFSSVTSSSPDLIYKLSSQSLDQYSTVNLSPTVTDPGITDQHINNPNDYQSPTYQYPGQITAP